MTTHIVRLSSGQELQIEEKAQRERFSTVLSRAIVAAMEQAMIREAQGLLEPGEELQNPEYLRGISELIARLMSHPNRDTADVAVEVADAICNHQYTLADVSAALYPAPKRKPK